MPRLDAHEAALELRAMGATPLEPFPGTQRPWRSVHDRCGREITPTLGNARRRGGVCRSCSAVDAGVRRTARLADAAESKLRAWGWEPIDRYPGADAPWQVRHHACGVVVLRSFNTIRSRPDSCNTCYRLENGHHIWTVESAVAVFVERGLTPLEPYPGSSTKPWRARHERCGRIVSPRLGNLAAGQGPCNRCGLDRAAESRRSDPNVVTAELRAAGFEPLSPFVSVDAAWPSTHVICGSETAPTLSNLRRGQGGCMRCGLKALSRRFTMPEAQARQVMLDAGLTPVEPYPGSGRPWRSRHACGRYVTPMLGNVRLGRGICRYCNSAFPYDGPAKVYLVADFHAVKIGCAARDSHRVAEHVRMGWAEAWQIGTLTGDDAYALEQAVVSWLRDVVHAPQYYSADVMPQCGATETAAWDVSPPSVVLSAVLGFAAEAAMKVEILTTTCVAHDARPECEATGIGIRERRRAISELRIAENQLAAFDEL